MLPDEKIKEYQDEFFKVFISKYSTLNIKELLSDELDLLNELYTNRISNGWVYTDSSFIPYDGCPVGLPQDFKQQYLITTKSNKLMISEWKLCKGTIQGDYWGFVGVTAEDPVIAWKEVLPAEQK